MFSLDSITNGNNKNYNKRWSYISDHLYRMLIIGGSGSGKINTLLNLIKEQEINQNEPKYNLLVKNVKM